MNVLLIISNDHGSNIEVLRCVGALGARVWVMGSDTWPSVRFSRYCRRYLQASHEDFLSVSEALIDRINTYCGRFGIDVVVPAGVVSSVFLARARSRLTRSRVFPLPDADQIALLNNKWRFTQFLEAQGLPCPRTTLLEFLEQIETLDLRFPVLLKPLERAGGSGIVVCHDRAHVRRQMTSEHAVRDLPYLAQEYVSGADVSFGILAENGRIRAWTIQRSREDDSGVDFIRHDGILEMGRQMIDTLCLTGIVEFDLRLDGERERAYLLECNPRFWRSVALSMCSGVHFADLGIRIALGQPLPHQDAAGNAYVWPVPLARSLLTGRSFYSSISAPSRRGLRLDLTDPFPKLHRLARPAFHAATRVVDRIRRVRWPA